MEDFKKWYICSYCAFKFYWEGLEDPIQCPKCRCEEIILIKENKIL
jgi:predicted Zn-ribbon and HTH transcriptional regulator